MIAYSDAFLRADVAAYDMFSARCAERVDKNEFVGLLMAVKMKYGKALPITSFDAQISGDLARATYTYDDATLDQDAEPWVREQRVWKQDDC